MDDRQGKDKQACDHSLGQSSKPGTTRRGFLAAAAAGAGAMALPWQTLVGAEDKAVLPNIIYIFTDQQHAHLMSCAGDQYVKTPAMDSLAASGVRFERAYCGNPVCVPSRMGMITGRMPSEFGGRDNASGTKAVLDEAARQKTMGWIFKNAGYEVAYGGKWHLPPGFGTREEMGMADLCRNERDELAKVAADFIKAPHDKPFLLVASFIQPHDICYLGIADMKGKDAFGDTKSVGASLQFPKLPADVPLAEFIKKDCPPLPANYAIPPQEPEIIQATRQAPGFRTTICGWDDARWRLHRWTYRRMVEMADAQIAQLLAALREAKLEDNTLIIFSSDHGDMDGSHHLEHKSVPYEESANIPFIVSFKGRTKPGLVDRTHLVSNTLDLIPTMCDYAGIEPPKELKGRSVRTLAEGKAQPWRDQLVVESGVGQAIVTARYKYATYRDSKEHPEQLLDLEKDPGEMVNLVNDPKCKAVLDDHRSRLEQWYKDNPAATKLVSGARLE